MVGYDVHLIKKDAVAHSVLVVGIVFVALLLMDFTQPASEA
jgi:hypothetical protein